MPAPSWPSTQGVPGRDRAVLGGEVGVADAARHDLQVNVTRREIDESDVVPNLEILVQIHQDGGLHCETPRGNAPGAGRRKDRGSAGLEHVPGGESRRRARGIVTQRGRTPFLAVASSIVRTLARRARGDHGRLSGTKNRSARGASARRRGRSGDPPLEDPLRPARRRALHAEGAEAARGDRADRAGAVQPLLRGCRSGMRAGRWARARATTPCSSASAARRSTFHGTSS